MHKEFNDINDRSSTQEKTPNATNIAKLCCGYGVNGILILTITCIRIKFLNEKINRIDFVSKFIFEENRYFFIENRNIRNHRFMEKWYTLLES